MEEEISFFMFKPAKASCDKYTANVLALIFTFLYKIAFNLIANELRRFMCWPPVVEVSLDE